MWWILAVAVVMAAALFYIWQNKTVAVQHITFESDRVQKEFSIALLSDLHANAWLTDVKKLVRKQKPDMIAFAGDVFDETGSSNRNVRTNALLLEFCCIAPCFYVKGNHEYRIRNIDVLTDVMRSHGVQVLENELCTVNISGQQVTIAGLDAAANMHGHFHTAQPNQKQIDLLRGLSHGAGIRLVLDHYPENFALKEQYSYNGCEFEAMFSGHAHGGQVRLPFIGALYAPGQGILPTYTSGLYVGAQHPDGREKNRLIVSRGMGGRWFLPRVFNRAQIIMVHVLPMKEQKGNQTL
ncbi:MAG: metallophosphoesterase [Clostridia bacterium]|nr:metallophosphoesterase [Clostridia bacterium]